MRTGVRREAVRVLAAAPRERQEAEPGRRRRMSSRAARLVGVAAPDWSRNKVCVWTSANVRVCPYLRVCARALAFRQSTTLGYLVHRSCQCLCVCQRVCWLRVVATDEKKKERLRGSNPHVGSREANLS